MKVHQLILKFWGDGQADMILIKQMKNTVSLFLTYHLGVCYNVNVTANASSNA